MPMEAEIWKEMKQLQSETMPDDFDIITDTSAHTGRWMGIMPLSGTTQFAASDNAVLGAAKDMSAINPYVMEWQLIPGKFTSIKLAGGAVIALKDKMK